MILARTAAIFPTPAAGGRFLKIQISRALYLAKGTAEDETNGTTRCAVESTLHNDNNLNFEKFTFSSQCRILRKIDS